LLFEVQNNNFEGQIRSCDQEKFPVPIINVMGHFNRNIAVNLIMSNTFNYVDKKHIHGSALYSVHITN
jgi:hypothetical protein